MLASEDTKAVNVIENKRRYISYMGCAHTKELCALDILEKKGRAQVFFRREKLDIVQRDVPGVADKDTIGRHSPEHVGLGVLIFRFRWLKRSVFAGPAAAVLDTDVVQLNIHDRVAGNAAEDRTKA